MTHLLDRVGHGLLDATLAATALSGLVVLAMVQCRQPARRLVWARTGLLATLAIIPLAALHPLPQLNLWQPLVDIVPATLDAPGPQVPALKQGDRDGADPCGDSPACANRDPLDHGPALGPDPRRWGRWPKRVGRALVVVYGAGVATGLGWITLGIFGSWLLAGRCSAPSPATREHHDSLPFAGPGRRPRLLVCDRVRRPVLAGWLRSSILIPPEFDDPAAVDQLRLALLHELAHAEAGDHRFAPISALAQAFWFFLPAVWWLRDQSWLDQEFLADRRAVAHFGTSGRYASSLVDLAASPAPATATATSTAAPGPAPGEAGPAPEDAPDMASALFQRVLMLLKCPFAVENRPPDWWRRSTTVGVGLATVVASCLSLQGLAGWPDVPARRPIEPSRSFHLRRLTITQQGQDDPPFDLRVRLPEQFHLSLEVMADPAELALIEVLGHRLQPPAASASLDQPFWLWHRVEIHRAGGVEVVRVDNQLIEQAPAPRKPASWLTLRPLPSQPTRIRDLQLSW